MGNFRKVKKKVWRLDDLLKIADNELERKAIEFEFEKMATKNSAGELVIDFGEDEINGTWLLINLQARHMERIFEIFFSEKGYEDLNMEDFKEFHELLTRLLGGLYI
jgi:hypothetical protein